ncbi:MAG TPA: DUF309 domain-containing protein [Nitrososphaerales archaeon]|nr:DUF309 domain-containing protein [Nitrososphaerales archaeon]
MTDRLKKQIPVRFLIRIAPGSFKRKEFLPSVKSVTSGLGVQARSPKWTSYGALELDLFAPSNGDIELALAALEPLGRLEFAKDLGQTPQYRSPEEAVREARVLFNAERYWESHEVLEGVWRSLNGEEKRYVQGVILVCAAYVHHQKGKDDVGLGVLRRAERQLDCPWIDYFGLDIARLKSMVRGVLESRDFRTFKI